MRIRHQRGQNRHRCGAHTVEFAFAMPILLAFLWGIIEIGRGFMVVGILSNAAAAGCRAAVVPGATSADASTAVNNYMSGVGVSGFSTQLLINNSSSGSLATAATGTPINVTVTVPVANIAWLPWMNFLSGTLSGQFTLPHE